MWTHLRSGLLVAGALALTAGLAATASAQDTPIKVAVVDIESVVAQSSAGQALKARLDAFEEEVRAEGAKIKARQEDLGRRIRDGANSLSADKLAELQQEYEDESIALRRYGEGKQREGQKMQSDALREIEQQLQPVFEQIQAEHEFDVILNNVPGVVVMVRPRVDITGMVLERFNASVAAATPGS